MAKIAFYVKTYAKDLHCTVRDDQVLHQGTIVLYRYSWKELCQENK